MGLKDTLGGFVPEGLRPPIRPETYEDFFELIQTAKVARVSAQACVVQIPPTQEEKEDGVMRLQFLVRFGATGANGRKLVYEQQCGQLRSSDPRRIDTRSRMVPDWDIRKTVYERIDDSKTRTFFTAYCMLDNIRQVLPQTKIHLLNDRENFSDESIDELIRTVESRKLQPWPNTPGLLAK